MRAYHENHTNKGREERLRMLSGYARAEPVKVEKHGRPVVVGISVEDFERLNRPTRQSDKGIDRVSVRYG